MILQFSIIVFMLLIGYMIEIGLALPVPASIIGMMLLLILLLNKAIKLEQVEKTSNLLLAHITLFILPLGIGLMDVIDLFEGKFLISVLITVVSTIISMFFTAFIMKLTFSLITKKGEKSINDYWNITKHSLRSFLNSYFL